MERYRRKGNPRLGPLQVQVALPFLSLMDEAAKRIGVNRATFIRRALAVQIAAILGRDIHSVLRYSPSAKPWGVNHGSNKDTTDDGDGIEWFCPHPGCRGSHLR